MKNETIHYLEVYLLLRPLPDFLDGCILGLFSGYGGRGFVLLDIVITFLLIYLLTWWVVIPTTA